MADTPKHSVSVAGIVVDDHDRILVIQRRDNGHWEPPGGVLELDESPEEGVRREVREETGVDVEIDALSGVYKNMAQGVVSLVFRCRFRGGTLLSSTRESAAVSWLDFHEATESMNEAYAVRVRDAFCSSVAVRIHDGVTLMDNNATAT